MRGWGGSEKNFPGQTKKAKCARRGVVLMWQETLGLPMHGHGLGVFFWKRFRVRGHPKMEIIDCGCEGECVNTFARLDIAS
jgi:hypothetical protein